MRQLLFLPIILLCACSPPVMFRVDVDERLDGGTLTLNGNSAPLLKNVDGAYWAKWNGADADGEIRIVFTDGASTICRVGYVTQGMGVQKFAVKNRQCEQVAT